MRKCCHQCKFDKQCNTISYSTSCSTVAAQIMHATLAGNINIRVTYSFLFLAVVSGFPVFITALSLYWRALKVTAHHRHWLLFPLLSLTYYIDMQLGQHITSKTLFFFITNKTTKYYIPSDLLTGKAWTIPLWRNLN